MVFSSIIFIFGFLPIFLAIYYVLPWKFKNIFTLLASYLFYAWGAMNFVWFLIGLTVINYFLGRFVGNGKYGKKILIFGIALEILALGYFKYANFFVDQLNGFRAYFFGFDFDPLVWQHVVLPLGISFFTFHGISYLVDVYKKHTPVEKNFVNFALYVTFFPQLIAGPIVRYHEIAEQIKKREHSFDKFFDGVFLFCCGLGMKVLLANQIAAIPKVFSDNYNTASGVLWLTYLCYTFQIYYDFAGYSKMAIGLGKMVGFEMPVNFNRPYLSVTVGEFWRRWHISLMNFFREYVYFPLGGSRVSIGKVCRNILIVFFLSGFWHGASWIFIAWGLYFGFWLIFERLFEEECLSKIPKLLRRIFTFMIIYFGWVIFSSGDLWILCVNLIQMFKFNFSDVDMFSLVSSKEWFFFAVAILIAIFPEIHVIKKMERFVIVKGLLAMFFLFYSVLQLAAGGFNPFIYFRF